MPIVGKDVRDVVQQLTDYYNRLLSTTVTRTRLVVFDVGDSDLLRIAFRQGGVPIEAPLRTRFGPMWLSIGQVCAALPYEGRVVPTTLRYRYTIRADDQDEPTFRWEYLSRRQLRHGDRYCRHHLQGPLDIPFGNGILDLNKVHLPTGYVTIEEVIRFCLVDLEAPPLTSEWEQVLTDSYEEFKSSLAPRNR
jgi:hypothetical protein